MKPLFFGMLVFSCPLMLLGQAQGQKTPLPRHPNLPPSEDVQTETIEAPGQTPALPSEQSAAGHLEPQQVKALLHRMYLAQFRLNDLLAQVHPDNWKMQPAARESFKESMETLRKAIAAEEDWRSQFDARPDSLYLGFQTYVAISAVLPRIDGVAHSVSHYENPSFGAQYSQAGNQLFDLQQLIEPHLSYLLKNQDNAQVTAQTNLASCERELNFAERNKQGPATPMKNIAPEFKGRKRNPRPATSPDGAAQPDAKGAAPVKAAPPAPDTARTNQ